MSHSTLIIHNSKKAHEGAGLVTHTLMSKS